MSALTPSDLDALAELERKATQGQWTSEHCKADGGWNVYAPDPSEHASPSDLCIVTGYSEERNAALIVSARNALPDLIRLARIGMAVEKAQERGA